MRRGAPLPWNEGSDWLLTPEEAKCLSALANGKEPHRIADCLSLEKSEVERILDSAVAKLDCHSRLQAVLKAISLGLLEN